MKLTPIDSIIIPPNRQRKEFLPAEIEDLAESIRTRGLMHPPVVRNDGVTLVAGERRLRAIQSLYTLGAQFSCNGQLVPLGQLPVTLLSDLSDLELREAELEENTIRLDLTWQEKAAAIAELHSLRSERAGKTGQAQTITKTAQEIHGKAVEGYQVSRVHEAVLLREHLTNPAVQAAKTQKDAVKIVRKIKEAEHRQRLAEAFDLTTTKHTLTHGDAVELLPTLPTGQFDCILTDPPYGVGADTFGDMADCGHNYIDSWENALMCYAALAFEGFRVTKPDAHLYAFCDILKFPELVPIFEAAGWTVWPKPMIWSKGNGMLPQPDYGPRYTYEAILYATKGSKRVQKVANDVICISREANLLHGAQKPVDLYCDLLARSVLPGDEILDCFAGSGTIVEAADRMRCTATAIEKLKPNYDIMLTRVQATVDFGINITLEGKL